DFVLVHCVQEAGGHHGGGGGLHGFDFAAADGNRAGGVEHIGVDVHLVPLHVDDPAGHGAAVGGLDDDGLIVIADHFAGLEDRFEQVARAEAAGQSAQVGAERAA